MGVRVKSVVILSNHKKINNYSNTESMKTNKFYLMIAVIMVTIGSVKAQQSGVNFGIKAGINYATLPTSFKEVKEKEGKAGYNVGVFARVGDALYFQPEVNYTAFKSEYTYKSVVYSPKFKQ